MSERFWTWLAWKLPRSLVYWATIRCGVHATTGSWSKQEVPATTLPDLLIRWRQDDVPAPPEVSP